MEDKGRKVKSGPQKWHVDVEWHVQCISFRFVSGPKGAINRKYTYFPHILLVQGGPEDANRTNNGAVQVTLGSPWCHFGFTLASFWANEGDIGAHWVAIGSLWERVGAITAVINRHFVATLAHFGVTLTSPGSVLASLWRNFGQTRAT